MSDSETAVGEPGPERPFIRLKRETPWGVQVGCSLLIAIATLGISGTLFAIDPLGGGWMGVGVIVVFGGIGLLMLFMFVHQSIARWVPETIVEITPQTVLTGERLVVRITQPGPVKLRSLRANLIWTESDSEGNGTGGSENFLDVAQFDVGEHWQRVVDVVIPENGKPTGWLGGVKTAWKIEIWGRVRFFPDFLHPFVIRVKKPDGQT